MYTVIVLVLLFVLPLGSTGIELLRSTDHFLPALLLKWFVFWGVGVRLLMAGVSQMTRPRYTADLLGLKGDDTLFPIRELGFANTAMGLVGSLSLALWTWRFPVAVMGVVFYGLAGLNHRSAGRGTSKERIAMLSDLGISAILLLLAFLVWRRA